MTEPTPPRLRNASKTPLPERVCQGCGDGFTPKVAQQRFCAPGCKKRFHNRALAEGAAAIHLVKASYGLRHAPPGSDDARLCRTARRELAELARQLNERDRLAGRPHDAAYVADLAASGSMVIDRRRG